MNCEQFEARAADFLEGCIGAEQAEELMAHVETCEACRAELQALMRQDRELETFFARQRERLANMPSPLPELEAAALAAAPPVRRSWPAWARMAAAIVFVACLGVLWQATRLNVPQGTAPVARLASAKGMVLALARDGQARLLAAGDPILQGARLKVSQGGYAALELPGAGNLLELKGGTQVALADFPDRTEVQMNQGQAWAHLPTHPARPFVIRAGSLTATAHGTVYGVQQELDRAIVRVAEGVVDVVDKGVASAVGAGQSYSSLASASAPSATDAVAWSQHQGDLASLATAGSGASGASGGQALASAMIDANATTDAGATSSASAAKPKASDAATSAPVITDVKTVLPARTRFYVELRDLPTLLGEFRQSDFSSLMGRAELLHWWASVKGASVMDELKAQLRLIALLNVAKQLDGQLVVAVASVDKEKASDSPAAVLIIADCKAGAEALRQSIEDWAVDQNSNGSSASTSGASMSGAATEAAQRQREDMEKHMQVAAGRLVVSSDEKLLASTIQALKTGTPTAFSATDFQKKISGNVASGTPLTVAVDLAGLLAPSVLFGQQAASMSGAQASATATSSTQAAAMSNVEPDARATYDFLGLGGLDYALVAPDIAGHGSNQAARLGFKEHRSGAFDWLAAPSPMRGLAFFSPETRLLGDAVLKNPAAVYYDLKLNYEKASARSLPGQMLRLMGRNKALLDAMGGEVAVGLENPILPIPNVKIVVELSDPATFQAQFAKLGDALIAQFNKTAPIPVTLVTTKSGERTIFSIGAAGMPFDLSWAFVDDFLVLGPGPRFVENSIQVYDSGRSIAADSKLLDLMPSGTGSTFSALAYQNVAAAVPDLLKGILLRQAGVSEFSNGVTAATTATVTATAGAPASAMATTPPIPNLSFLSSMDAPAIAYAYASDGSIDLYLNAPSGLAANMGMAIPVVANWLGDKFGNGLSERLAKTALARKRLARLAAAAEIYKQDRGHWPTALSDLTQSSDPYLKAIPLDPFGLAEGDALRLVAGPGENQVTFYSIGPDGVDDHGAAIYDPLRDIDGKGDVAVTLPPAATGGATATGAVTTTGGNAAAAQ